MIELFMKKNKNASKLNTSQVYEQVTKVLLQREIKRRIL
jgi:hypothetical protein